MFLGIVTFLYNIMATIAGTGEATQTAAAAR
jgi:hypothetical protein